VSRTIKYWLLATNDLDERIYPYPLRTRAEAQKRNEEWQGGRGWLLKCELEYHDLWDLFEITAAQAGEGSTLDTTSLCQYASKKEAEKAMSELNYYPPYDRARYISKKEAQRRMGPDSMFEYYEEQGYFD
jgi:hypothetical protein